MLDGATSLDEFCAANSVSRATAYREIEAGRLEARKVGRKTIVTKEAARHWLKSLPRLGNSETESAAA
jgi:predicted site-specific integrase-resolvase